MAKVCMFCWKEPRSWNNRSHSNRATKRWYKPNIILKKITLGNWDILNLKICASCYKNKKEYSKILSMLKWEI